MKGKAGIVTGGARGIGAAAGAALCEAGASVVLTDVQEEAGRDTVAALAASGHSAVFESHDVRDRGAWDRIVANTLDRFGRIDFLVNNAGLVIPRTIEDASVDDFTTLFDVNVLGPFHGMQAVIPVMKAGGGGSIINIASSATKAVKASTSIYGATKAAQATLSKAAAVHLAETGTEIRINTIHPGPVDTEFLRGGLRHLPPAVEEAVMRSIPIKRFAQPQDISGAIVFLASDAASYITGAELYVDGGSTVI